MPTLGLPSSPTPPLPRSPRSRLYVKVLLASISSSDKPLKLLQISFSGLSDDDIDASNTFTYNLDLGDLGRGGVGELGNPKVGIFLLEGIQLF